MDKHFGMLYVQPVEIIILKICTISLFNKQWVQYVYCVFVCVFEHMLILVCFR